MAGFGEGIIQAGEKEVRVFFNNRALAEAEQQMGKSVIGVAEGFADGRSGVLELAHLLRAGMTAATRHNGRGKPASLIQAYQVMDDAGFAAVAEVVMVVLADVLGYDPKADDSADDEDDADPNE